MDLNDQQEQAVRTTAQRTMVIAAAGSGKTRVIIGRIAYLIEELGVSPYSIIAFSFTRKSAGELKERLVARLGNQAHRITTGTTHSIAADHIRRYVRELSHASIYGPIETELVLKDVAEEVGVYKKKTWKPSRAIVNDALLQYGSKGIKPDADHPASMFFQAFSSRCSQNRAMTYDDLLVHFLDIIPLLSKYLKWTHVFVDEAQDLTPLQWSIVNSLSIHFRASVFAVGDISQAIYRFRGASSAPMLQVESDGWTVLKLETNYRSLPAIVEAGERVIKHCPVRMEMQVVASRTDGVPNYGVHVLKNMDSASIVAHVKDIQGVGQAAVLSRTHSLLQKISRLLAEAGVDHLYLGGQNSMLKELPAITLHSFLRLCRNRIDNFSFMVVRKALGLSDLEYANIRLNAAQQRVGHLGAWISHNGGRRFTQFFVDTVKLPDALRQLSELGQCRGYEYEPVMAFASKWMDDNAGDPNLFIQDYLDYVALFDVQDEIPKEDDVQPGVILSTIHGAKGLEFPKVIIIGMNEGIFPSRRVDDDVDELTDEVRLAYVGITRAMDSLYLTSRPESSVDAKGNIQVSPVSRFVGWAKGGG